MLPSSRNERLLQANQSETKRNQNGVELTASKQNNVELATSRLKRMGLVSQLNSDFGLSILVTTQHNDPGQDWDPDHLTQSPVY